MMLMKFIDDEFIYDGSQLQSLYAYRNHGLLGDSIVAWIGPCDVKELHMKDGEDLRAGAQICGDQMLHFIVEKFDIDFFGAVSFQRLLTSIALDLLVKMTEGKFQLRREGDDIFNRDNAKLSISVAAASPVSHLIHFALNIVTAGTPVRTFSLSDMSIEPRTFALKFMESVALEVEGISAATRKVFPAT